MTRWPLALLIVLLALLTPASGLAEPSAAESGIYSYQTPSRDGIGKLYFGREIAQVMGHRGAAWLERSSRAAEERPDQVVAAMALPPDARVADIGTGTGYFTFRLAPLVPEGRVFAVDVQPEMLTILEKRIARRGIANVEPVLGEIPALCCNCT